MQLESKDSNFLQSLRHSQSSTLETSFMNSLFYNVNLIQIFKMNDSLQT